MKESDDSTMTASALSARFPEFLASVYSPETLDRIDSTIAAVDHDGTILWVNEAWRQYARDNGGDTDHTRFSSYFDGIAGPLKDAYREVFATAIATSEVFEQDYECSSPDTIRLSRLRVLPFAPHGLLLEHTPIASHAAPDGEPAIELLYVDDHGHVVQCSNCRRVRRAGAENESWAWVPAWVARPHPRTSHGLCASCTGYYWRRRRRPK